MISSVFTRMAARGYPTMQPKVPTTCCRYSLMTLVTRAMSGRTIATSSFFTDQTSRKVMREPPPDSLLSFSTQFYRHPNAPIVVGWVDLEEAAVKQNKKEFLTSSDVPASSPLQAMNRNARRPKAANRGKRAVSRQARRAKKRAIGNHRR
ncbi:hypothetical protein MPSEU_000651400 [Mayamaea pseudoterrestris]|nr:hypothetical protein MPSEU_000651400 [Mayamaea pseudoterrestris]